MLITVKTFNGHNINDGTNYRAYLLNPHGGASARPVFIDQAQADSQDAGTFTVNVQSKVLSIEIVDYANRNALIAQLKTWFKRGIDGELVVTFSDDDTDYQMTCRVISLVQDPGYSVNFQAILQTGFSTWRAVTETTETVWALTTDDDTQTIDVGGKDETFLSLDIETVAGPATGYLYQDIYRLPNTPGLRHGYIPWCIVVDTATLVTAGKMQADCDDLRIVDLYSGREIRRWIADPNTSTTKVWINLILEQGFSLVLGADVAGSGDVPYLQFAINPDSINKIARMPKTGIVYHGNEWFYYSNTDSVNCRLFVSKRGLYGTTEEAHTIGQTFLYIQYPLLMKYGNATTAGAASTDAIYDDAKPLINLSSSSNIQWVWTAADKFFDPDHPFRSGLWRFYRTAQGPNSKVFYIKQDAESGDPAIGLKVASFQSESVWKNEQVILHAILSRAAGISSVSMTGDKYRSNANWPPLAALRRSFDGVNWPTLWTEASPASQATWTAWTHNSVSVAAGSKFLQLILYGGYPGAENAFAALEALTATVDFNSSNIPTGAFLGEQNNFPLELTIENETTGDSITLEYMMLINKVFAVDGEQQTAQYDGANAHSAVSLDDEGRSVFLRLQGDATNSIRITGNLGELDVTMRYYARRL